MFEDIVWTLGQAPPLYIFIYNEDLSPINLLVGEGSFTGLVDWESVDLYPLEFETKVIFCQWLIGCSFFMHLHLVLMQVQFVQSLDEMTTSISSESKLECDWDAESFWDALNPSLDKNILVTKLDSEMLLVQVMKIGMVISIHFGSKFAPLQLMLAYIESTNDHSNLSGLISFIQHRHYAY